MGRGDAPNITGPSRKLMWFPAKITGPAGWNVLPPVDGGPVDNVVEEPADRPAPGHGPGARKGGSARGKRARLGVSHG